MCLFVLGCDCLFILTRFCIDCKTKVLHAHGLLIGDDCKKKDKGFNAALYDGVDYCKNAKHVHIRNNTEFIALLIARAEPDLMGRYDQLLAAYNVYRSSPLPFSSEKLM